jgi:cation transport protein ChaC
MQMPVVAETEHVITREALRDDAMRRMIAASAPNMRLLTEAERAASLEATLAARPEVGDGVWLFAYGSLIWNPALHFDQRRLARVHGWHRSFCLSTQAGRGTPDNPGLVLGLDRGGACSGAAFHISEALLQDELSLLWRREMLSGSYRPRWVRVRGADGVPFGHAIAFTILRDGEHYAGCLSRDDIVRRLASACGALGSSAEYLFHTRDGLRSLGIQDAGIEDLARRVERASAAATRALSTPGAAIAT